MFKDNQVACVWGFSPISLLQTSHLAMIDTLMMAYTVEMISVERVLTCVQKYSPFFPEEDFPYDAEEAVTTWINKVRSLPQPFVF